jgi:hypothetical protein
MRMWLLVGRNSNPSSSHGTSSCAVPGFPSAVFAAVILLCIHDDRDGTVVDAGRGEKAAAVVANSSERVAIFMMLIDL